MNPLVSVVIPAYNAGKTLSEAVESVRAQQYEPLEILVVDDASTDDTPALIKRLGDDIRALTLKDNQGPSAARNHGIRSSRGEVIALLDADDLWPEGKLDLQVGRLHEDDEIQVVSGRTQLVSLDGTPLGPHRFEGDDRRYSTVNLGAAVFRREAFNLVGLFDEGLRFSEDQDWFLRAREEGLKILVLKDITLVYRRHQGNMTLRKSAHDLKIATVLKRSLDRRRKQAGRAADLGAWSGHDDPPARRSGGDE